MDKKNKLISNDSAKIGASSSTYISSEVGSYWDQYYLRATHGEFPDYPSQFACFVLSEIYGKRTLVLDLGCGVGRDTFFFAHYGIPTIGVDNSKEAIERCLIKTDLQNEFICSALDELTLHDRIVDLIKNRNTYDLTIYSRFFLHAIDEINEIQFFELCSSLLKKCPGRIALEFRTDKDRYQTKTTPKHFRRYIDPGDIIARTAHYGFKVTYFIAGFGYAKYRDDDAHVCRMIIERS